MTKPTPRIPESTGPGSMDAAVLRIFTVSDSAMTDGCVGLGFLVTEQIALTCAHVVATALNVKDRARSVIGAQVRVDLPLLGPTQSSGVSARVEQWFPGQSSGAGDVAVLRLDAPLPGARPVRLVEAEQIWGHSARAFGLPDGRPGGVWHSGVLRHRQANGWVQVDLAGDGYRVSPGFSGGPVWDDELAGVVGMMAVAESGHPPASYLIPTSGLLDAWPSLRMLVVPPSPFRGLRPFVEADAALFHGRQAESERIAEVVAGQRWTTVVGPSGCGKSSLAMAGVIPQRRAAGDCPIVIRPGHHASPLHALAAELLPLLEPELSETQRVAKTSTLVGVLAEQGLHEVAASVLESRRADRLLVVVDQFEELLDIPPTAVDDLAGVLFSEDTPSVVKVLCTLRADFLEPILAHPRLGPVAGKQVQALEPMRPEQLREVITRPVNEIPGVHYEPNLAERILIDTGTEPGALPLLGFTLDLLWERLERGVLTHRAYSDIGGVAGALGAYADRAWTENIPASDEPAAARLLTQLARVPIGATAATRRIAPRAELGEQEWRIAQRLAATRLLVVQGGVGSETVELAHEALITSWARLARQIAADRSFLDWRESLRHDVARWERGNRDPDLLPSLATLAGATGRERELNDVERNYIKQGHARQRVRVRRRRSLIGLLSVLILAVGGTGIVSVYEQQNAAQRAAVVRSGALAADSRDLMANQPGLAAQLAVAAYRAAPTQDATTALYAGLQSPLLDNTLTTVSSTVADLATQAGGPLGAATDHSGTVHVWNLGGPTAPIMVSTLRTASTAGIALAPHVPLLAAACATPGLCLWNLTDPAHPALEARLPTPAAGSLQISSMAISPDGTLLAATSETGQGLLWSIADPAHPRMVANLPTPANAPGLAASVAFAPAGGLLAVSTETGILRGATRLYSLSDPAAPTTLATINAGYRDITINPAGTMLAGADGGSLDVWNISRPTAATQITYGTEITHGTPTPLTESLSLGAVSFSPDGGTLAIGGPADNGSNAGLCLLNLTSLAQNPQDTIPLCMSTGFSTLTMAYTDSGTLLTGGGDGTVRLWHPSPEVVAGANGYFLGGPLAVSADGRLLAAATAATGNQVSSPLGIWNLDGPAGPALQATLPQPPGNYAAFLEPDVLLSVADLEGPQLWNVADPHHPRQTATLDEAFSGNSYSAIPGPYDITFSPARGILADGVGSGVLELYHVTNTGTATLVGSLTDSAAALGGGGVLATGDTAFMLTSTGIDWWNISDPAHPVKTGSSPLNTGGSSSESSSAATLFAAAPAPAGRASDGTTLNLYNLDEGHAQSTVTVAPNTGGIPSFSADGHLLAAYSAVGNELTIWDTTHPRTPKLASSVVTVASITGITFSTNGNFMANWNPQTLQLWDTHAPDSPVLMGSFSPADFTDGANASETISAANFAAGGKLLITVHANPVTPGPSLVYLLDTNPQQAIDQLCSITTNPITPAQWAHYVPGTPYQNPCSS